ncbi:MAG TPA: OsmC family protein [Candidatus Krumholzibacteria bacterium]|nr:OsmC family protein [Candidatus Krumholzibacteria bacterium]HPD73245.1 OsmC family protein [Candidatus Krumholzibacteria bacterium]HRY40207.1 OsmC family protein [Candidatus Krumholzibacteria bacterium]
MIVRTAGETTGKTTVRIVHEDSGSVIETMAPRDNGGEGRLFSPTDLCATSLGACAATIMNMYAHNAGIPVEKISFTVEKEMSANPRRIGRLTVRYEIATDCGEHDFRKLVSAGKTCPLRHSIHPDIVLEESYVRVAPPAR